MRPQSPRFDFSLQGLYSGTGSFEPAGLLPSHVGCPPPGKHATGFLNFTAPFDVLGSGISAREERRAALQSADSTLTTADFPHTPAKLYTEPARIEDASPFNLQMLDFLGDELGCELSP